MNRFPLTHTFGVTRKEYYTLTGITPHELIRFYEAENVALEAQRDRVRKWLRKQEFTNTRSRYLLALFNHIGLKLSKNEKKIKQIKQEDLK